jgi:hypothetical protein
VNAVIVLHPAACSDSLDTPANWEISMDPTLTWWLLLAAVVLMILGGVRFDVLVARWRDFHRNRRH